MSRIVAPPPTDKGMWRRLLKCVHPDSSAGGDHDLFIWSRALFEHVSGNQLEEPPDYTRVRRDPPKHHTTGGRIPFDTDLSFADLTHRALWLAEDLEQPYSTLLGLLGDCLEVGPNDAMLWRQQQQGATYKSLAALAYRAEMSKAQRVRLYRIAESIPLAQRHVGDLLSKLG
jgi:hypothetical protein